ncbi:MAG: S8 family serine peptidase [Chloroflexi bacterium]|nr:S8 family serine peptidase [Chloroflexota bacterium]
MPGRVVVMLNDGASIADLADDVDGGDIRVVDTIPELRALVLGVPVGAEDSTISRLLSDPRVASAERSALLRAQTTPDDPIYPEFQWSLRKIGMERVWEVTTGAPTVVVAVLDTGVDATHPDLVGNLLTGYDYVNDDPDPADDSSHGTYIAGVIAAIGDNDEGIAGLAWQTKILPVKVLDDEGLGPDAAVSKGMIYAVENRAKIINLSSGTTQPSRVLEEAVRFAERRGVLVVAAAGNSGDKENETIYPAAYAPVVAVAATDEKDNPASFSQRQPYVTISAPGVEIPGPAWRGAGKGAYILSSGTSAAAAHVSGLAALMLSVSPGLTPADARSLIYKTAEPPDSRNRGAFLGAGRIDAARAVGSLRPLGPVVRPTPQPTATPRTPGVPGLPQPPRLILPTLRPLPQKPLTAEPTTWYFAEGNTMPGYDTWLVLQNPLDGAAAARVTFMTQDGPVAESIVSLKPNSRRSIHVNDVVPGALLSMKVESSSTLFAERSIYFGHDGTSGVGTRTPARTWYLAEGSTQPPFDTWLLLFNPNPDPATAHLVFMLENGETVETDQPLAPQSRTSFDANDVLSSAGFATAVTADLPIVVERTMYFGGGGGHTTLGLKTPGTTWFLAEGDSRSGRDTWILLQNPNPDVVANVAVTFIKDDATTSVAYYALDPNTRLSVFADTILPNTSFGARIDADQPIIVERSIYVADGAGGHNSTAVPIPNTEWFLPDGSTRDPYREVIAVLNPGDEQTQVDLTFMQPDGQPPVTHSFLLPPTSRLNVEPRTYLPDADISTRVLSDHPVVVERSMYFDRGAMNSPGQTR